MRKLSFNRIYYPTRPSFVSVTTWDGIRSSYRVERLCFFGDHLKNIVVRLGKTDRVAHFIPAQLRKFRSGRWAVGDGNVNQSLVDYEKDLIERSLKRVTSHDAQASEIREACC